MKIAVIGPGSMGLLYATGLSTAADVILLGNNKENLDLINKNGITVKRGDDSKHYNVAAYLNGTYTEKADLVILFTKAYITRQALTENKSIIGENTVVLTLQNGAGHESTLKEFVADDRILIGTTAQGSYRENAYTIVNSGLGDTNIGAISNDFKDIDSFVEVFNKAGFPCFASDKIHQMVWNKLMINASSSVLSGVLGVAQGYVATNANAWEICKKLIAEICATANAAGCNFSKDEQIERINKHLHNAPNGYTSIYADLKNGRKTEVDVISGAVVKAAKKHGITAPTQELLVDMVKAMEERNMN